jgi:hypothetical protein
LRCPGEGVFSLPGMSASRTFMLPVPVSLCVLVEPGQGQDERMFLFQSADAGRSVLGSAADSYGL